MAFNLVAHVAAGSGDTNNVTTGSITTTGANLLVLILGNLAAGAVTISDSKTNTWTALTKQTSEVNDSRIYYSQTTTVGSGHTFTATSVAQQPTINVMAFSGSLTSPFDVQNGYATSGGLGETSHATGSVTPSLNYELIVSGLCNNNGTTASINSSFTLVDTASSVGTVVNNSAYLVQTTATAVNPTWTFGGNDYAALTIATFKAALNAGGMFEVF